VYADVQVLLDQAIAGLAAGPVTALPTDLTYAGHSQRWARAANTLKARYHLHVAPRVGAAAYTAAIAAANAGINEAPTSVAAAVHGQAAGDWRSFHGNTLDDGNIWSQFLAARADIAANQRLIGVLNARGNDPRLAGYFDVASDGQYRGANQWGAGPGPWSLVDAVNRTPRPFRQPFVTWTENQLILAEAHFQTGNAVQALIHLNNVRTSLGMPVLGVPIDLEQIMVEKWIAQFQNVDVYSDYRRTCYPRLVPGGPTVNVSAAQIPGRVPYGGNERLQNPNIPPPSQQPARNWNFATTTCPTGGGTL
ncbi:MAG TPA: SusD/RagB family nutrient-binding outer membrane lipoprotein, partial [Longimicrobiaceae bacterium]|nr:SusD/RagB family nutrient-binding outer membrane lipoprotein [Longimicrobiaceae bacterium]